MPFSWDPYDGNYLPNCCEGSCQYVYNPETGERYPVKCNPNTIPDYLPDPGQCVGCASDSDGDEVIDDLDF